MANHSSEVSAVQEKVKIVARNIRQTYKIKQTDGSGFTEFVALKQFDLTVRQGEFLAIVGPSGCGKSTFLDMVAGLTKPNAGEILIDGKLITGPALDRGIVMQGYALFPWRTVQKNVEFGLEIKKIPARERKEISKRYIELVGLEKFAERYPHELSGGMKQRVAIARALAYDPEVLLMDEPFAALDAQTREILQEELLRIWGKTDKTVIFVTHGIDEAVFLADRVAVMTANPGTLKEIVEIDLPRPRDNSVRSSAEFGWFRHKIWELLQGEQIVAKPPATGGNVADHISASAQL